ncbi:DUF4429 domain-containing protein [Collimonas antrihumi]|uniref:DUF4429 domain-containing protein n=1 Tax=Collimonas antrihumi TaxID=1940615 RepID=UPI001B8AE19C
MEPAVIQVEIQLRGVNGQVTLLSDRVQIKRAGAMARLTQSRNGDKDIPISALSGVRIELPGLLTNGYIRFYLISGTQSDTTLIRAANDENTVLFNRRQFAKFAHLKSEIEKKIAASQALTRAPVDFEQLDLLAEQYKQGLISRSEWISTKKKLLGL